jgi:hypothetical protein
LRDVDGAAGEAGELAADGGSETVGDVAERADREHVGRVDGSRCRGSQTTTTRLLRQIAPAAC